MHELLPEDTLPTSGWSQTMPPLVQESALPGEVVEGRAAYAHAARIVVGCARFGLCILSQELEPNSYGTPNFADSVKTLVLMQKQARLRVLVGHGRTAARGPHSLVELGRIVTSRIEFRELPPNRKPDVAELVIADGRVLLERRGSNDMQGYLYTQAPHTARERQRRFDVLWEDALPCQDLRRLSL